METYNAKEAGKLLGIQEKTVTARAIRLGFKKIGSYWCFKLDQIEKINGYVPARFFNVKFSFSEDGKYLIINSKMNTIDV